MSGPVPPSKVHSVSVVGTLGSQENLWAIEVSHPQLASSPFADWKTQMAPVVLASEFGGLGGMQNMTRAVEARKGITARKSLPTWPPSISSSGL